MAEGIRRKPLMQQVEAVDKEAVQRTRKRFGDVGEVYFRALGARRKALKPPKCKEAALVGVQAGDITTGGTARHWKGGDGKRQYCNLEKHTIDHQHWSYVA